MNAKLFLLPLTLAAIAQTSVARADDVIDYCSKVRARAAGDADLFLAPSISLQGIKYPATGTFTAIGGSTTPDGYQARASFLWSPLDAYKSVLVRELGDKDCAQQIAIVEAQEALEWLNDIGKENALVSQVSYLEANKTAINDILVKANARMAAGYATVMDLTILQQNAALLETTRVQAQGQLTALRAKRYVKKDRNFTELMQRVQDKSMDFERSFSKIRMLDPWKVDVSGGVVPPMASSDSVSWFGIVSLTYNFGGLFSDRHESDYLSARSRELKNARYELSDQLSRFRDVVKANINDMHEQMATVSKQIDSLEITHSELKKHMDAIGVPNAEALVQLQIFSMKSNRVLYDGMLTELTNFYGDK